MNLSIREIRFRGQEFASKEWMYGSLLHGEYGTFIQEHTGGGSRIIPETAGEYTGVADKNRKEIYEGDILRILEIDKSGEREYITPVIWEDCSFLVRSGKADYDTFLGSWAGDPNNTYPLFELEVIGNIHENPELLRGKE